ncbi:MAG: fatty acid desaturase [Flavobacterium sp.]|nr:fatty acid desaturase [Pedobacter sp.]
MKSAITPGVLIAVIIIVCWSVSLSFLIIYRVRFQDPFIYLFIVLQMFLYTGLFITAHDSMHGTVSPHKTLNNVIGQICTALFAAFLYKNLYKKHHDHHRHVHTEIDPDYHNGNFWSWYFKFMREYITWQQILIMAILFNILKIWFAEVNLLLFWVLPSLLSTLQLFYFGTWLPHHGEPENVHQSRTQKRNHVLAFLSCYFFGYHFEHHDSPGTPWWKLWTLK